MKLITLIVLMILFGAMVQAAGRQQAFEICTSMSFDRNRDACISAIGSFEYFDQAAIDICTSMSFDSGKLECIQNIGNKTYEVYESENCAKKSFDINKNQCLNTSGRPAQLFPPPGCLGKQDMIFELQRLDRMVYQGENLRARNTIYGLINSLQACP